jgi:AraC-like DNA-binding protein
MSDHFVKVNMDWLTSDGQYSLDADVDDECFSHPLPPNAGVAHANMLKTSHSISIYSARHEYDPEFKGDAFNKSYFYGEFEQDTFMIGTAFGSKITHNEQYPECTVELGGELTLFRHANHYEFDSIQCTTQPMDLTFVALPVKSLVLLIGEANVDYMLSALDISKTPAVVSRNIPLRISLLLKSAISPELKGRMKQLYSQAKVLEYLCELITYIESHEGVLTSDGRQISIVHQIHEQLSNLDGKLPSTADLAEQTNMSAQTLNQAFRSEFGLSIHRFMSRQRLQEAHSVIQETDTPLKELSYRLGYSHVNHFITAFTKQFGYSPGSLRKKIKK